MFMKLDLFPSSDDVRETPIPMSSLIYRLRLTLSKGTQLGR
jgi:hypothetical protein